MNLFQTNERERDHTSSARRRFPIFGKKKTRVAGGHKAVLPNRRTSRRGRNHAKQEHRPVGNLGSGETHLPFMTKVKRALGMQSTPRKKRQSNNREKRRSALL
ncbi:hypothetical protein K503DRAFT_853538 [Rhizopogon vinicolor AM-OR11-026]|uniref:Uncharacterized protein n=1 Tax=Rhizopogon vinicolor AM-OR11-026 TaxID=1314800 RepID=A0A1B7NDX1_9AGAM|nr:hypothetical protein K503DRAFT_853538 [Rhizopogon vinicolor AM-OR11-026]